MAKLKDIHFDADHKLLFIPSGKTIQREIPLPPDVVVHFKECAADKLPNAWHVSSDDGSRWKKVAWRDAIKEAAATAIAENIVLALRKRCVLVPKKKTAASLSQGSSNWHMHFCDLAANVSRE